MSSLQNKELRGEYSEISQRHTHHKTQSLYNRIGESKQSLTIQSAYLKMYTVEHFIPKSYKSDLYRADIFCGMDDIPL